MKRVQKGLIAGMLCVSMTATGLGLSSVGEQWKQSRVMAEVASGINVWYGGDVVTNQTITMAVGEQLILSTEAEEKVEWTALDAKVVNVLTASGTVTGVQEGSTTVTVRTQSGKTASIQIIVANPVVNGSYKYVKMSDNTAKLVEYTETTKSDVTVPAKIDNLQVTHIGYALFGGHMEIRDLTFEYGIRSIGEFAMARTGLRSVTFPASISSISKNCFDQGNVGTIYCIKGSVPEQYAVANGKAVVTAPLEEGQTLGQPITDVNQGLDTLEPVSGDSGIIVLTNENFDEQINAPGMLIIDISTTWCNPCQRMKPYYDQLARVYKSQVRFASLDGDKYVDLVKGKGYRVDGYPTLLFLQNGELIANKVGYRDYDTLENEICTTFNIAKQEGSAPVVSEAPKASEPAVSEAPKPTEPAISETPKPTKTPEKISLEKVTIKKAVRVSKTKMKVIVKKVSKADGYKVVYADNAKFKKQRTVFTTSTSKVITGLNQKKSYYIKVTAYKKDGQGKKIYGKVSKVKKVK